jgi:hypothetical protein
VIEAVGVKISSVFTFIAQLILSYLLVLLFLIVTLIIIGHTPVMILFTSPGIFLQAVLMIYFWVILFALPDKPQIFKKKNRN